jgi:hypothetical protein
VELFFSCTLTAASVAVVPLAPISLNLPLLMSALLFVWGGSIGGY